MRTSMTTLWTTVFDRNDCETTRQPLEFRYPFADVRLVRYLLAIPVVPWCTDKALLREAMRGVLPEEVRRRRKTPLAVDPLGPALRRPEAEWMDRFDPAPALGRYVNRRVVPAITGESGDDVRMNVRPLCLSRWLQRISGEDTDVTRQEDDREPNARDAACGGGQAEDLRRPESPSVRQHPRDHARDRPHRTAG
jgi:hypothetical protein